MLAQAEDDVAAIHFEGPLVKRSGGLPRVWDQRHTLNIDANFRLNERWHFSLTGLLRSGWPDTPFTVKRIQREDGSFAYFQDRGVFRGDRLPSYQRLDARINRHFHTTRGRTSVFLHVINLTGHENVIRYDHDVEGLTSEAPQAVIESETWFGTTPFLGVSWEF